MPIYEYECEQCGHTTEAIQKVSAKPLRKCAECGGKLERLISSPAIQFKGTGWYITDYARKGQGDPDKATVEPDKKDNKKDSSKKTAKDKTSDSTKTPTKKTKSSDK